MSLRLLLAVATLCVAASITHLVSVEVIEGFVSPVRMWTNVAVMPIEAVINVAVEVGGTLEPRARSDEHASAEPLGSVWRSYMERTHNGHTGKPVLVRN
jgi:hypothetical protein